MKKLITLLFVLFTVTSFSQELQWENIDSVKVKNYKWFLENKSAVELEFVRLIDSARQVNVPLVEYRESYTTIDNPCVELEFDFDSVFSSTKELKEYIKNVGLLPNTKSIDVSKGKGYITANVIKTRKVSHIVYDSVLTLAAEHHTKFQLDVEESGFYSHGEFKNYFGYEYTGNIKILEKPEDRVRYYCPNRYYKGECCTFDPTNDANVTNGKFLYQRSAKEEAYNIFLRFKKSNPHWAAYMRTGDVDYIGSYLGMNPNTNYMVFVTVMGTEKKTMKL